MIVHSVKVIVYDKAQVAQVKAAQVPLLRMSTDLPPGENPSFVTKAKRLRKELTAWLKAGAKLVPTEVRRQRLAICEACQYYNPRGNMGLGACQVPGCGCTRVKLALATSKCPFPGGAKWPAYAVTP